MHTDARRDGSVPGRQRLVWHLLAQALESVSSEARPAEVLDCGGGSGSLAVPLARAGAHVTVVDVSADALATLTRRADEAGVADRIRPVQSDVESLAATVSTASFDLVLSHGILEAVEHVGAAFDAIAATVRPGGLLSVLVDNPVAAVLARALAGDVSGALRELRALDSGTERRDPSAVQALCRSAGLVLEQVHGIGVFAELIAGSALELPGSLDALAELEAEAAVRRPFCDIAGRVHILARCPQD